MASTDERSSESKVLNCKRSQQRAYLGYRGLLKRGCIHRSSHSHSPRGARHGSEFELTGVSLIDNGTSEMRSTLGIAATARFTKGIL